MKKYKTSLAHRISQKNRKKKFKIFLEHFKPTKTTTVLDIGVTDREYSPSDNYLEKHYPYPENITAITKEILVEFPKRYPHIKVYTEDATSLSFKDNTYDIVHSNAVIEHVGGSDSQILFLKETYRVSRNGFITTPNKYFPIELHTRIPFLHFLLPKKYFDIFLGQIGKKWATGTYMNLLSEKDLRQLLKYANISSYSLIRNKFFGFTMTFTIIWKK